MVKLTAYVVLAAILGGCSAMPSIDQERKEITAAKTGCPPSETTIVSTGSTSWEATCKGKTFYCSVAPDASCAAKM